MNYGQEGFVLIKLFDEKETLFATQTKAEKILFRVVLNYLILKILINHPFSFEAKSRDGLSFGFICGNIALNTLVFGPNRKRNYLFAVSIVILLCKDSINSKAKSWLNPL